MFVDGIGQQVYGPSQYATLDMVCFYGCEATGAGNCTEVCQQPSYSTTGTAAPPKSDNLKWWILGGLRSGGPAGGQRVRMHANLHPALGSLRGCIFPQGSWLAKMLCGEFAADVYEEWQYGKIPLPIPPEPPGTPAMTPSGEAIYTPGQDVTVDLAKSSLERTQEAYQRYVDAQIAAGKYTPEGKLALTAEEAEKVLKDYGPLLLIGGGALVLLLLLRR